MDTCWLHVKGDGIEVHPHVRWLGRLIGSDVWMYLYSERPKKRKGGKSKMTTCAVYRCRHRIYSSGRDKACSRCKSLRWRVNNPVKAALKGIRDSARKKNIFFSLTLEQFTRFAEENGYMVGKGRFATQLHIDRIDPLLGYEEGNIRTLTCSENSAKGAEDKKALFVAQRLGMSLARFRFMQRAQRNERAALQAQNEFIDSPGDEDTCPF